MLQLWKARQGRKAAVATIAPLIAQQHWLRWRDSDPCMARRLSDRVSLDACKSSGLEKGGPRKFAGTRVDPGRYPGGTERRGRKRTRRGDLHSQHGREYGFRRRVSEGHDVPCRAWRSQLDDAPAARSGLALSTSIPTRSCALLWKETFEARVVALRMYAPSRPPLELLPLRVWTAPPN